MPMTLGPATDRNRTDQRTSCRDPVWSVAVHSVLVMTSSAASAFVQATFDELGTRLRDACFVVVDLETTGGSPAAGSQITEIGAVKVRGGVVLGEFQTLVRPDMAIPPFIAVLTGITDRMVATAPRIDQALPPFLDFIRDTVIVAHNAPFDVGFLQHACASLGLAWPLLPVVDTAKLARRVVNRDEAPNCKLSSLARLFGSTTRPNHRALSDARATVDVLHGLIERLGNLGVHTVEELQTFSSRVTTEQRRKRHLAEHLPHAPGVYMFADERGQVLYVGKSRDLRTRVRTYFTASETRSRMGEMVNLAASVRGIVCATDLEAAVRELRLIARHKPRYNRRSKFPERGRWVKLTVEPWPRLSLVRTVLADGATYLGPFGSRARAEQAIAALHESFPIRQCAGRLPKHSHRSACVLAEMGRCLSPCNGASTSEAYDRVVDALRASIQRSPEVVARTIRAKMDVLATDERYEEAIRHRDRLVALIRASARTQRLSAVTRCPELVAARRDARGRWEVHVIRYGRLAAAGVIPGGVSARDWVEELRATAETVIPGPGPAPAATAEETEVVLRWLEAADVRLIRADGDWTCPVGGAESLRGMVDAIDASRDAVVPFDQPRDIATRARPVVLL
jgi:DNA polymerase III subunit epsilon